MEAAVAGKEEHTLVGVRYLSAYRRAHTEAHCAHAARGEQSPFVFKPAVLSYPHLVLSNVGGDDVAVGFELIYRLDELLGEGIFGIGFCGVVKMVLPFVDFSEPDVVLLLFQTLCKSL